jgi:hypothetical protein
MFLMGQGCPGSSPLFNGQEMVGKVTATSATIKLVAGDGCDGSIRFRLLYDTQPRSNPEDYAYQTSQLSGFSVHDPIAFGLHSLLPNTRYYYRVAYDPGTGWAYRDEYRFHTQRSAGRSFRFCITADTHIPPSPFGIGKYRRIVYENVLADGPDILIMTGDDYYGASQATSPYPWPDQETLWKTWARTRGILDFAGHSMFTLAVNGNHEGLFGWTTHLAPYHYIREGKMRYLPVPDAGTFPEGGDSDGRYGAFTWGGALFVWLDVVGFCPVDPRLERDNSLYVLGDDQKNFLESTLQNSSAPWKFLFAHHLFGGNDDWVPGYGRGNANHALQYEQAEIQTMMELYGVQAFFYGHDHVFSMSRANGIPYITCGNAGSGCPWKDQAIASYPPHEIFVTDGNGGIPSGHVRVDVAPSETTVSYINASTESDNGAVLASFDIQP